MVMTNEERSAALAKKEQPAWMCKRCEVAHNATTRICGGCFEEHTPEQKYGKPAGKSTDSTPPTPQHEADDSVKVMRRDYEVGNWDDNPWSRMA